ncbi:uncharacterized protein LOC107738494 isoform X1 [Sinocyclocheilus rhinocerous]|uniref:uncharacterized protein LOC107738494 isoform X1 n=1 Tax=Sinocyclocheilus rhinocerous TaxID=307959 RepID=UPI0007B8524C|nr:PREDICTED: uncharacterized protein LOC107738494 isoform X1 [Sinocyclocheilus rhinocerous]
MCRKYATNHYHLAMHVFGALTTASTLKELDDMVQSATVVFSSPSCGASVEKHFKNLQSWLQKKGTPLDETTESRGDAEDLKDITGSNRFAKRCNAIISNAPLDKHGELNVYQCKGLIDHLKKYILPFAGLWTGIMLGDLGRHGTGPQYEQCSRRYNALRKLTRQNITQDNKTQGIMEKSQWDLKHIRFTSGRLTRLDDFVAQYQISHTALLKEYEDSERVFRRKTYRVEQERWKEKQQKKRGRYVTPIRKPFLFKTSNKKSSVSEGPVANQSSPPQPRSSLEGDHEDIVDEKAVHGEISNKSKATVKTTATPQHQLTSLWKRRDTEVVVSVIPTQTKGTSMVIRHSELRTLQPHQWLTGEIIEALFHIAANELEMGNSIYILDHYTAGVNLFGERPQLARQSLSKINIDNYQGIVSFVNTDNVHWKFLCINAVNHTVYLVDPSKSSTEEDDSIHAAKKFRYSLCYSFSHP